MTIKQLGGVFGRNPTFNDVTIEGELTFDGAIDVNSDLTIDGNLFVQNGDMTMTDNLPRLKLIDSDGTNQELYFEESGGIGSMTVRNGSNNGTLRLRANNGSTTTNTLEIDTSGNVKVLAGNLVIGTSGKGIDFSATSDAPGATSELLDDYEEGTFSPTLENVTITYDSQSGTYTKIGRDVFCYGFINVATIDNADSSSVAIGGLPFTPSGVACSLSLSNGQGATPLFGSKLTDTTGAIVSGGNILPSNVASQYITAYNVANVIANTGGSFYFALHYTT